MEDQTILPPTPPTSADEEMDESTPNNDPIPEDVSSMNLQSPTTDNRHHYGTVLYLRDETNCDNDVRMLLYETFKEVKPFTHSCACISYAHQNGSSDQVDLVLFHPDSNAVATLLANHENVRQIFQHRAPNDGVLSVIESANVIFFTDHNDLKSHFSNNQTAFVQQPSKFAHYDGKTKIFNKEFLKSGVMNLSAESAAFVWFRLLIELILKLSPVPKDRDELLKVCEARVQTNDITRDALTNFENEYNRKEAIRWYSIPSSVFKLVNNAFRTEQIDYIYCFRLLIRDLRDNIFSLQEPRNRTLYRGALMPVDLLLNFKDNEGHLVSMNWFMSTTEKLDIAELYSGCGCNTDDRRSVIFEFTMKNSFRSEPHASLGNQTNIIAEEEVLFSVCSIWHIERVQKREGYWYIQLRNAEIEDPAAHSLEARLREKIGDVPSILTLACFLYERGDYGKAEYFCHKIIHELPNPSQKEKVSALNLVGLCRTKKNDPYVALNHLSNTIQLLNPTGLSTESTPDTSERGLGENAERKTSYPEYLRRILLENCPVKTEMFSPADVALAVIYNNIALVHYQMWNLNSAKKYLSEAVTIFGEAERHGHQIAFIYNNLATVCYSRQEYNEAVEVYRKAIVAGLTKLDKDHPFIKKCKNNLQAALNRSTPRT